MPGSQENQAPHNSRAKNVLAALLLGAGLIFTFNYFSADQTDPKNDTELSYDEFIGKVKNGDIKGDVTMQYTDAKSMVVFAGKPKDASKSAPPYHTVTSQPEEKIRADLRAASNDVKPAYVVQEQPNGFLNALISWGPVLLLAGVIIWSVKRQMGSGGADGATAFGKSRAKLLNESDKKVTFADVAGVDEAKEQMVEIVEFLRNPEKFTNLGGKMPKGTLLVGPPGTGKTLLAKAVAGEADVPFYSISGSDFVEMFVGVGASRVRDLFETAKKNAPCIIFIDEIDALGKARSGGNGAGGHDEKEQTLNQFLVEIDGFDGSDGIMLIAATNRPEMLDPALTRAGRFGREVTVDNPDKKGREDILAVHTRKLPLAPDVNLGTVARGTPGFSGADLAELTNGAALAAARRNAKTITMKDFEHAKDTVLMGPERKSRIMSHEERLMTAYHEAGHAVVGLKVPGNDPLHMVSIIPRGRALGVTVNLPENDRFSIKKFELKARMAMAYGGRAAEEMIYGSEGISGGASNDIVQATKMARAMITQLGMSEKLGSINYGADSQEIAFQRAFSESTQHAIDEEVRLLTEEQEKKARQCLEEHKAFFVNLAQNLMKYEKLTGDEVRELEAGREIVRAEDDTVLDRITSVNQAPAAPPPSNSGQTTPPPPTLH